MSEKKKKKEKVHIALPSAWKTIRHRNETGQARANYEDMWKAIGIILLIALILFILLGGVNQKAVLDFFIDWGKRVGEAVSNWLNSSDVVTNENGVYVQPH